jgi:AAA+ superfamily predicted ATPase/ribosomal protein S18 acetylase RimI-like enzyme
VRAAIRWYDHEDLSAVLELWEAVGCVPRGDDGLSVDEAVELIGSESAVTLVGESDDRIAGMVLCTVSAPIAWIHRLAVATESVGDMDVADQLLEHVEAELVERGARTVASAVGSEGGARRWLERRGYVASPGMVRLERQLPRTPTATGALARLGGRIIEPGLWEELRGLENAKQLIERRVILPLAKPQLAARHAVSPPKAIVLFGPPGTGKTTFAKGIASRLGWPFVEIQPARLGGQGPEREAELLAATFDALLELGAVVVFIDEVEDIASVRPENRRVSPSLTNELLRQIPRLRDAREHLLVCATNWVARLDPAFLRPGRFDYVLAVGPPDGEARAAIWQRYVDEISDEQVDVPALVDATELFTPADIEFAARKAAQRAFEREHFHEHGTRATTTDFLAAIEQTRPSLSREIVTRFEEDMTRFARD